MTELVVVGEGQTEEAFIRQLVAPALAERTVFVTPRLLRTSREGRGGGFTKDRVLHHLPRILNERDDVYVSTFFDLYGLAPDFPGLSEASASTDPIQRAVGIEAAFGDAVVELAGCRRAQFVPHIQPHEFESLLFADVAAFATARSAWHGRLPQLARVRKQYPTPEHINDGRTTHPSARLGRLLSGPNYNKRADGPTVAANIGLPRIREECRHFAQWLSQMEALPPLGRAGS